MESTPGTGIRARGARGAPRAGLPGSPPPPGSSPTLMGMRSRSVLWLVPILLAVHNAEEALFFPRYLPFVLYRLPVGWQAVIAPLTTGQVGAALGVVTAVAFIVAWCSSQQPDSAVALWLVLLIQATVLLNVVWHLVAAVVLFGGYAPGVVTALLLNLRSE